MPLVVQKFGGTSVADSKKILAAARRAIQAHERGNQVLVVVSARGHTTDELIDLAKEIHPRPPAREMDMLLSTGEQVSVALMAMAIQAQGVPSISFTGAQIGIETDSYHTKARIRSISTERMQQALGEGKIVIVAGFQGVDENDNITTLGRGGSDTTAVALAAVLQADACEIYTDVDGVYTTDPRVVPSAKKIDRISFDEMLELASLGAGVMHSRSIEFAKKYGVPIHVRSSFKEDQGSWIVAEGDAQHLGSHVTGAALAKDEARITLTGVPDKPGVVRTVFGLIAKANIVVDMIVQNIATDGVTEVSFTVSSADLEETRAVAQEAVKAVGAGGVSVGADVAKVSVVGLGMRTHTGVAKSMFEALAKAGINIHMITTSEIKISVLVDRDKGPEALRVVHQAFNLDRPSADRPLDVAPNWTATKAGRRSTSAVKTAADAARGMEDILISGVDLDSEQTCVTLFNVPDEPGIAARVFEQIARDDVFVDMIVQNVSTSGFTHLSFTTPARDAQKAKAAAEKIGLGEVRVEPTIAKLSVLGVGMRTHTGVATRMFGALADEGINITLINTSEVRINVATDHSVADRAKKALEKAFPSALEN